MNALYLVGFIQSLFVSSLILLKKNKALSDYVLAFYIWVIGFFLFTTYAHFANLFSETHLLIILDILYWTLIGPALYIYIDLITTNNRKFRRIHLIHLIPTIIVLVGFSGYFLQTEINNFFQYQPDTFVYKLSSFVWYYNSPIYYVICLVLLYRHSKKMKSYYSFYKNVDLKWLHYLVHGFAAFLLFGFISGLLRNYLDIIIPFSIQQYNWLVMVVYIFGMGYYGYRQKGLFVESDSHDRNTKKREVSQQDNIVEVSYQKSGLTEKESRLLSDRLQEFMIEHKPYLNCELNLRELANQISISPHKLSQIINDQLHCNFYEYINAFRIEEVKKSLIDPRNKNLKIMAIAYDCGFNSKSAFYTIFKKYTSKTPSEYREELLVI